MIGGGGTSAGHGYGGGGGAADAIYEATKAKSKVPGGTSSPGGGSNYGGYSPAGMNSISSSLSGGSGDSEESSTFGGGGSGGGDGNGGAFSRSSRKNGLGLERGSIVGESEANALYMTSGGEKKLMRSIGTQTDSNMVCTSVKFICFFNAFIYHPIFFLVCKITLEVDEIHDTEFSIVLNVGRKHGDV